MKEWSGFYWPEADQECAVAITLEATMYMGKFLAHVPGRNIAVQGGGNVGVYPLALARQFHVVHTFEPEPENVLCLQANISRHRVSGTVIPHHAALGAEPGTCGLLPASIQNTGTYHVHGDGPWPMQTIDGLYLDECDLIWLDVEGMELKALRGAAKTIDKCRPVIIVEDKGLAGEDSGASIEWLHERGYRKVVKHGNDVLMAPTKKD